MLRRKRNIYIDMDDVLCDTAGHYIKLVKRIFDLEFGLEEIHSFNLQESFGLSKEENALMFKEAHKPDFTLSLEPFPGIADALHLLQECGYSVDIVTGRHTRAYSESLDWLQMHAIPFDTFTMVDKYGWPDTDRQIAVTMDMLSSKNFDCAIEDNLNMVTHLAVKMKTPVLLFDRPWNRNFLANGSVTRCYTWPEISSSIVRRGRNQETSKRVAQPPQFSEDFQG